MALPMAPRANYVNNYAHMLGQALVVFVRATAVILFVLFCSCNRYLFLYSAYGVPLAIAAFPCLSDLLASHSSESCRSFFLFSFFLFFLFSFLVFFFSLFLFSSWSGLFCCVLVPGARALHLLCSRTRYESTSLALP